MLHLFHFALTVFLTINACSVYAVINHTHTTGNSTEVWQDVTFQNIGIYRLNEEQHFMGVVATLKIDYQYAFRAYNSSRRQIDMNDDNAVVSFYFASPESNASVFTECSATLFNARRRWIPCEFRGVQNGAKFMFATDLPDRIGFKLWHRVYDWGNWSEYCAGTQGGRRERPDATDRFTSFDGKVADLPRKNDTERYWPCWDSANSTTLNLPADGECEFIYEGYRDNETIPDDAAPAITAMYNVTPAAIYLDGTSTPPTDDAWTGPRLSGKPFTAEC